MSEVIPVKVVVVYESHFGNTGRVAHAVAEGLRGGAEVEVLDIEQAPPLTEVAADLLVIGAPTHVLGLSRPDSRREALEQIGLPEGSRRGIREWLEKVTESASPVAVYDTRTLESRLPGSAARTVARRLRRRKVTVLAPPEHFTVHGIEGPLTSGEEERAVAWGRALLGRLAERAPGETSQTSQSLAGLGAHLFRVRSFRARRPAGLGPIFLERRRPR